MIVGSRCGAVPAAFDAGASAYDRLVGANPGYHAHLRMSARRMRIPNRGRGLRLLDAGCGTGASTVALLAAAPEAEIVAVDASAGMLAEAARQAVAAHRSGSCTVRSRTSPPPASTDRSTASSPRICCAT